MFEDNWQNSIDFINMQEEEKTQEYETYNNDFQSFLAWCFDDDDDEGLGIY